MDTTTIKNEPYQSFGYKTTGLLETPKGYDAIKQCKKGFADLLDQMNNLQNTNGASVEQKQWAKTAIRTLIDAHTYSVAALTSK